MRRGAGRRGPRYAHAHPPRRWGRAKARPHIFPSESPNRCSGLLVHVRPTRPFDKEFDKNHVKNRNQVDMKD